MDLKVIDSHIHLDWYERKKKQKIINEMPSYGIEGLITVSNNLSSAKKNLKITKEHPSIYAAFGYHPEQELPKETELMALFTLIKEYNEKMVAIGEVGLPYYSRKKDPHLKMEPYKEIVELFIEQANIYVKPIILHAVYEDADVVCDLLEKHSIKKAHFHWFKGDKKVLERMRSNGYFISITPDVLYENEIKQLVKNYPLSFIMVETDGPWPFKGPFENKLTHPKMLHKTIEEIALLKNTDLKTTYEIILQNTKDFYEI